MLLQIPHLVNLAIPASSDESPMANMLFVIAFNMQMLHICVVVVAQNPSNGQLFESGGQMQKCTWRNWDQGFTLWIPLLYVIRGKSTFDFWGGQGPPYFSKVRRNNY